MIRIGQEIQCLPYAGFYKNAQIVYYCILWLHFPGKGCNFVNLGCFARESQSFVSFRIHKWI